MLRAPVMQKKEDIEPESGASEKFFEVMPSRMSKNAFLERRTDITSIQSNTKNDILYSFI